MPQESPIQQVKMKNHLMIVVEAFVYDMRNKIYCVRFKFQLYRLQPMMEALDNQVKSKVTIKVRMCSSLSISMYGQFTMML
nr:hypothetical protein [Tanacetum cinerariifolium]